MNPSHPTPPPDDAGPESRRTFLSGMVRVAGLGSLAALVAGQELKRRRLVDDPECIRPNVCADCVEFGGCDLPKAVAARRSDRS